MTPEQEEEIPLNSFTTLISYRLSPIVAAVAGSALHSARVGLKKKKKKVRMRISVQRAEQEVVRTEGSCYDIS